MNKKALKYRFYPTPEQAELLAQTFGCVRVVYNNILDWRTKEFYDNQAKIGYKQANARLTAIKKLPEFTWLNQVSCVPLQQALRHQQSAFSNFFSGRARYPTFKKKTSRQSAEFTKSAFKYRNGNIYIAKSKEPLDVRWSRELPSEPSSINISKDAAGRYFVSCVCEFESKPMLTSTKTVGIDLGIKNLVIADSGKTFNNPRFTAKYAKKLAKAQRVLAKKKLGSANRAKAKAKVARIHAKISDCRIDNLHKLSRTLINENQVVYAETLKVKNMVKNSKLSKAISDASWGELLRQLEYKAQWAGRELVRIDQFFPSSKRCNCCGHTAKENRLTQADFVCVSCRHSDNADINAAKNIKVAGQAILACGECVSLL